MRTTLLAVALAGLLLLAGCTAPLQSAGSGAADASDPTVAVTGTGTVSAEADLAVVSLSVTARASTADAARDRVAAGVESVREALGAAGVPADAVTTAFFAVQPSYDDDDRVPDGYRAVHALRVEVDPARAGEVVDVAVGAGATGVDGVRFTLTDERRDALRAEALALAVDRARADADAVAGAADLRVTGVQSVVVGGSYAPAFDAERAADDRGATTFTPGPVTVSASVSITYTVE